MQRARTVSQCHLSHQNKTQGINPVHIEEAECKLHPHRYSSVLKLRPEGSWRVKSSILGHSHAMSDGVSQLVALVMWNCNH